MDHFQQIKDKILTWEGTALNVQKWQQQGEKVVFSNGCFDLVHRGHVEYLSRAASLGQRMVLGLNTDLSVRKLKGDGRPVVDEYSRSVMMASFSFIDVVVLFGEETPFELIKTIQPDFLVKGSDYVVKDIVGYDIVTGRGGEVKTIDLVDGFSTTALIDRIKKVY